MRGQTHWPRWVALVAAVGLLSVAGAAAAGLVARQAAAKPQKTGVVNVSEKEWSLVLTRRHLAPGTYKFVVKNKGKIPHSFAIAGSTSKHEVKGLLNAGATKTLTLTLKIGRYTAYCPIPGHAEAGMRAAFIVGTPPPLTSSTASTSTAASTTADATTTAPATTETTTTAATTTSPTTTSSGGSHPPSPPPPPPPPPSPPPPPPPPPPPHPPPPPPPPWH